MTTPDIAGLCERQLVTITHKLPEVAFLAEAARHFETRPTGGGEDAAHWSNVFNANAKNCRQAADTLERQAAEIERLRDKVEGLESDLRCAVQVAYNRGATEWARLNYPDMIEWLESCAEARAALTGEDT